MFPEMNANAHENDGLSVSIYTLNMNVRIHFYETNGLSTLRIKLCIFLWAKNILSECFNQHMLNFEIHSWTSEYISQNSCRLQNHAINKLNLRNSFWSTQCTYAIIELTASSALRCIHQGACIRIGRYKILYPTVTYAIQVSLRLFLF